MRASYVYFVVQLDVSPGVDVCAAGVTAADVFNAVRGAAAEALGDVGLGALSAGGGFCPAGAGLSVRFWSPRS